MHQDGARTMARYNAWMNRKLISKAQDMGLERIEQDQKAFFGSIAATFQHIMIGDLVWLRRYAEVPFFQRLISVLLSFPEPKSLHERIFSSWHAYTEARSRLDDILINFADSLTAEELATEIEFRTMKGDVYRTPPVAVAHPSGDLPSPLKGRGFQRRIDRKSPSALLFLF